MRAIVMSQHGGPDVLTVRELPDPVPADGDAVPEVYAAAWVALHANLGLAPGQTLLVRGATSSVGQAAVNLASAFVLGDAHFPLAGVPLQEIVDKVERGAFAAAPKRVFAFAEVAEAHRLMDAGRAGGKLVVTVAP